MANCTTPFYVRDLSFLWFCYQQGVLEPISVGYRRMSSLTLRTQGRNNYHCWVVPMCQACSKYFARVNSFKVRWPYEVTAIFIISHFTDKETEIQNSLVTLEVTELVNRKARIQTQTGWLWGACFKCHTKASLSWPRTESWWLDWGTGPAWGFRGGWVESSGAVFTGQ